MASLGHQLPEQGLSSSPNHAQKPTYSNLGLETSDSERSDESSLAVSPATLILRDLLVREIRTNPSPFFTQASHRVVERSNRFRLFQEAFDVSLNRLGRALAEFGLALTLFEAFLDRLVVGMERFRREGYPFYTQWGLEAPGVLDHPVISPYMRPEAMSATQFLADLTLVATSRPVLFLDRQLTFSVSCLGGEVEERKKELKESLFGALRRNQVAGEYEFVMRKKARVITIPPIVYDADCLLGSIVLGLDILSCSGGDQWKRRTMFVRPLSSRKLRASIINLADRFPSTNFNEPQDLSTCQQVQAFLTRHYGVSLVIYNGYNYLDVFFRGPKKNSKEIHLLKLERHLSVITDYKALFGLRECQGCLRIFERGKHRFCFGKSSDKVCRKCLSPHCLSRARTSRSEEERPSELCHTCGGVWTSTCFLPHQKTSCPYYVFCPYCARRIPRAETENHKAKCLRVECKSCSQIYSVKDGGRHFCLVQRPKIPSLGITKDWAATINYNPGSISPTATSTIDQASAIIEKPDVEANYSSIVGSVGICCFDIETRVGADRKLRPVLISAVFACSHCAFSNLHIPESWSQEPSPCCGQVRKRTYVGSQIRHFILDLFFRKRMQRMVAFAHYGSGFDFIFICKALLANGYQTLFISTSCRCYAYFSRLKPKLTQRGSKILSLALNGTVLKVSEPCPFSPCLTLPLLLTALRKQSFWSLTIPCSCRISSALWPHHFVICTLAVLFLALAQSSI